MRIKYEKFIAEISDPVLADRVDDSARTNASDSMAEIGRDPNCNEFWITALETARMILDDWKSFYPELRT